MAHRRDHGGVTFIDLRDREGVVQLVFHPADAPRRHGAAQSLGAEDVVRVTGVVGRARRHGNPDLDTGEIEVAVTGLEPLTESDTPPFPIEDRTEANEDLRLKYRYLDLRRPEMTQMLGLRRARGRARSANTSTNVASWMSRRRCSDRAHPRARGTSSFRARLCPGEFYALPQSPQQLKQLLMVAGQDRYYQTAGASATRRRARTAASSSRSSTSRCRSSTRRTSTPSMEPLFARLVHEVHGVEVATPFPRLTYHEVIDRFGSDKPDLRYGMELADLNRVFAATGFNAFAIGGDVGGRIQGIAAPGGAQLSRKELDQLVTETQGSWSGGPRVDGRRGERCALARREAPLGGRDRRRARGHGASPATWS